MASGSKARKREESALKTAADTAAAKATEIDPAEAKVRARLSQLADIRDGKSGPLDVRNIPGADLSIKLFNSAKQSNDAGRIGRGLAYGENSNTAFAKAIDTEAQLERDQYASGLLENEVDETFDNLDDRLLGIAGRGDARNRFGAELANNRYTSFANRPRQPGFLEQAALGAIGSLSFTAKV